MANRTKIVRENIARETRLHTDESRLYTGSEQSSPRHETVKHSENEYARGDITTNTVEGYFSIFKRGMRGIYQHCKEKHFTAILRNTISASITALRSALQRWRPCGACHEGCGWQAPHV